MTPKTVINIRASQPAIAPLLDRNPNVQKIIIGESPTSDDANSTSIASLPHLDSTFSNLSHLYLWKIDIAPKVASLPSKLRCLEVRACKDLTTLDNLPINLETIVIEDCPLLQSLPELNHKTYSHLRELSLAGCPKIPPNWIHELVNRAPQLTILNLSRCNQLEEIPISLPSQLEVLELNDCTKLNALPMQLPSSLRRLGLRGSSQLALPSNYEMSCNPDYIDLAMTTSLLHLPKLGTDPAPRTLYLYGSGILAPPSSEHGTTPTSNVAEDTLDYFREIDLVGKGSVQRCKLLFLGNGYAGKTELALNLIDKSHLYPGTTHGVQFWDWPNFEDKENRCLVNLHLWDFGGQEIYHNAHRNFVSRGSVFLVVWNPEQDGKDPPPEGPYQDTWYPVKYWIDSIHAESPHQRPLIAIVCSHQGKNWQLHNPAANEQLKRQLLSKLRKGELGNEYQHIPLFVFDSKSNVGERDELMQWIKKQVSQVVASQGTVVPTYWEIAQNMVEPWLPKPSSAPPHFTVASRKSLDDFTDDLDQSIQQRLRGVDGLPDLPLLKKNYTGKDFLTTRRVERTLRFLTHSGWLYWDKKLLSSHVIIDQRAALERIYAALDRRKDSSIFPKLQAAKGQFTFAELRELCWSGEEISEEDQRLILGFMESLNVCFKLTQHYYSEKDTIYISPAHLPESDEDLTAFEREKVQDETDEVKSDLMHRGHWFAFMRYLCSEYGTAGTYTLHACHVTGDRHRWNMGHEAKWSALFRFEYKDRKRGLGGKISIQCHGDSAKERLGRFKNAIESFMPEYVGTSTHVEKDVMPVDRPPEVKAPTVFFSYAWDPVDKKGYYEEAVDAIEQALKPFQSQGKVNVLRDKSSMRPGDYITEFVTRAGTQEVDYALIFTSDKYWTSWWCMMEFCSILSSLMRVNKGIEKTVIIVVLESGEKRTAGDIAKLVEHWENLPLVELSGDAYPAKYPEQLLDTSWKRLRNRFISVLQDRSIPITSDGIDVRKKWQSTDQAAVIAWVLKKLGLNQ
jgi:internalin A